MFKEVPSPITEAGGEFPRMPPVEKDFGLRSPREAAELEKLGKRIIVIKHRQEEFQC